MRTAVVVLIGILSIVSCGGESPSSDPRVDAIRAGTLPADNLIVYDRGQRQTMGPQVLDMDGSFKVAGPTIVYVFRSFSPGDRAALKDDGIDAEESTAHLLPEGESATLSALQRMQRIGPVDPASTDDQLAADFMLAEAMVAQIPTPNAARRDVSPSAELRGPESGQSEKPSENVVFRKEDEEKVSRLRTELMAKHDAGASEDELADLTQQLALAQADLLRNAEKASEVEIPLPAETICSTYSQFDQSDASTTVINESYLVFAGGFASTFIDYEICGAQRFEESKYIDFLIGYCTDNPEKTIQDSIAAFVCEEPL